MPVTPTWLALGLLLPAAIAAGVMTFALRAWRRKACGPGDAPRTGAGWAVAVGLGMAVAIPAKHGFPAGDAWGEPLSLLRWNDWLWLALPLMTAALVGVARRGAWRWLGVATAVIVAAATTLLLLWPDVRYAWSPSQSLQWVAGVSAATVALMAGGYALSRLAGRELPPILGLTAVGAGLTITFSGSESVGLTLVSLGAVMAGGGFVALFAGCRSAVGSGPAALFVLAAGDTAGYFGTFDFAENAYALSPWEVAAIAASPLLGFLAGVPLPKPLDRAMVRAAARVVVCLAPAAVVAARAGVEFFREVDETAGY